VQMITARPEGHSGHPADADGGEGAGRL
jgi:hypothetical protein